ncbi:MAG: CoA-binding protein [Chitinophagales bacterium]|nr:CoA-binding protein [Chitinophagales bacterium]MDW8392680.1 CoA-binding protein [Chitinophagales bacterium]
MIVTKQVAHGEPGGKNVNKWLTVVIGVSARRQRFANLAVQHLVAAGYPVVALGNRAGWVDAVPIVTGMPALSGVHTVTLYLNAERQKAYYAYLLRLRPMRVIFNPGTENEELAALMQQVGTEVVEACTLTLLASGRYGPPTD